MATPNHSLSVHDMNNKLSYIGEVSHNFNSPPNLGSPRFSMGKTQESGSPSLTNVIDMLRRSISSGRETMMKSILRVVIQKC